MKHVVLDIALVLSYRKSPTDIPNFLIARLLSGYPKCSKFLIFVVFYVILDGTIKDILYNNLND